MKFKCVFVLIHTCESIGTSGHTINCTPSKPKKVKVKDLRLRGDGFDYIANIQVNPNRIEKISMTKKPDKCYPKTTTIKDILTST